jgi:hypothetical protein
MAIGLALLLGFRFPDNFDRPYAAVWFLCPFGRAISSDSETFTEGLKQDRAQKRFLGPFDRGSGCF